MMKLKDRLINFWHDVYYYGHPKRRIDFALRCKEVAGIIDLAPKLPASKNFRFHLHLSVCQPCRNYRDTTVALKNAARRLMGAGREAFDVSAMNARLLDRFKKAN